MIVLLFLCLALFIELLVDVDPAQLNGDGVPILAPGLKNVLAKTVAPEGATVWLVALVALAFALAVVYAALDWGANLAAQWAATGVVERVRAAVLAQAFRLGGGMLDLRQQAAEELFGKCSDGPPRGHWSIAGRRPCGRRLCCWCY